MAHFFGTITGAAGKPGTRRGSKTSGLVAIAASWQGAVRVSLAAYDNHDHVVIELVPWKGKGTKRLIWQGYMNGKETQCLDSS